jgi:hypothetical protein
MGIKAAATALVGMLALAGGMGAGCGGDEPEAPSPIDITAPGRPGAPDPTNGAAAPAPAAFNDDRTSGTYDCEGQNITVNSQDADLHLVGECATVVVNGERARVVIDDAELIVVNGEDARATYSGDPEIVVTGEDATAEPA